MMVILSGTRRMRYAAILAKIIVVALVFALMWVVMPAGVAAGKAYGGVDFPLGDKSFADGVVSFNPGTDTVSPYNNSQSAIGTPEDDWEGFVALGHEGILTVRFTDNYLIDVDGPDLYVFEFGPMVEPFKVEISKDGLNWIDLGTVRGQPTSLDIHDKVAPGDKFSYVRITDANSRMSGHPWAGADIDAVGAIGAEEIKEIILKASKDGYASVQHEIDNDENFGSIDISGKVTEKAIGYPIEGALVKITSGATVTWTITAAGGAYTITALVPEGSGSDTRDNVNFELEETLSRVEIEQVPKRVVKLVPATFIAHAYDYENKEISPDDLAYEWYIGSSEISEGIDRPTLEDTFDDDTKSYWISCEVTYDGWKKRTSFRVVVEPFTVDFCEDPFSPMAGEKAIVKFKVNTKACVSFDNITIPSKYYPDRWYNEEIYLDQDVPVAEADIWYSVPVWDGRVNNRRPAINGPYTVKLRAKPLPWSSFEDKTCKVLVYDDPGKFVSIESVHTPLQSRGYSLTQGYANLGERGEWNVMITKVLFTLGVGGATSVWLATCPMWTFIVGAVVGCGLEVGTFLDLAYTAREDYSRETLSLSPCVTDIDEKYGSLPGYTVLTFRDYVLRTVSFTGPTVAIMAEKRDKVSTSWFQGPAKYVDPSTIKKVVDSEYRCFTRANGVKMCDPGIVHEIKDAQIYGKDTAKGREYREFVLKAYKRSKWVNVLPESRQQLEGMTTAGSGYSSEPIYDFRPLSTLWKSHISAQSQPSEFTGSFSDHGTDTDGDGLYDTLTILAGVDVSDTGTYIIEAALFDDSGAPIVWSGNYTYSEPGIHDIALEFNGITLYRHGAAGPYNLKYIRLYDGNLTQIDDMTDAYATSAYDYADFQTPPASFNGTYSDHGTDTDSDGLFNRLTVSLGVDVLAAGNYTLTGNLVDGNGEPIAWANITSTLDTGNHRLDLDFDGVALRQHSLPGPYNLSVSLMSDGTLVDSLADAHTTSSYSQDDFQPAAAQFNGVFSDQRRDTDGDGRYNYLTLSAGVDVFQAGGYTATGYLYDENENLISWASETSFWNIGSQTVYLDFDGVNIRQHAVNGAYAVSMILAKEETPEEDLSYARYATSAYDYADFQGPPDDFHGNFSDYGRDTDDDGFFNYLALSTEMTISNVGGYSIVGNLYDKNGELITWASDYAELDVGSQSLVLYFDGFAISKHAVDGPYDVSLALLRDGNPEEVLSSSSYTTSAYSHTDFQAAQPPIASFTYSPLNPVVNETIIFNASNSYDSDGFIVNYEWDFGDGFNKTGEVVTHAYTSSGNYNVILTVTDNDGAVDTETTGITVSGAKTIYVDDDFTDDPANHKWDTIQEGITDANAGDTVLVYNGTYTETVVLNKRLTLTGEGMPEIDAQSLGDAINITADNCTVKGFNCVNAQPSPYAGIRVDTSNNVIADNTCNDNYEGIYLLDSSNEIRNNIAKNNQHYGIRLQASDDNIIKDNTAKGNGASGIRLKASDYNRIMDNDASNSVNYHGISVSSSNNNEVRNNVANSNHYQGIRLWSSCDNIIAKNTAKSNGNNGIYLKESNDNRITDNDVSNTVNYHGIYLKLSNNNDIRDNTANTNGEDGIYLNLSHDNRITGNDASNNVDYHGISLKSSSNNEVRNNVADSNHYDGIKLWNSTDNIMANNTVKNNEDDGISLTNSNNNRIYMNNFMDNDNNVKSEDSTNIWHSPSELDYIFKGNIYKNYLGNYWGDYTGSDTDNDGIGDSHYIINSDKDIYPLKKPLENYFVAPETNFDTGEPANSYPSIMGTHTGTIKPNQPITISKLYTYSCPGTGGHTEYIWVHGNGVDASAAWDGYQSTGDYHCLKFTKPFTLEEGVTYYYTIRTGSYPQIHHTSAVQTATGWLNCTAFEDKNGKVYYDRIPAVKFFY